MFSFSRDFMCKKADEVVFLIQKSMSPKKLNIPPKSTSDIRDICTVTWQLIYPFPKYFWGHDVPFPKGGICYSPQDYHIAWKSRVARTEMSLWNVSCFRDIPSFPRLQRSSLVDVFAPKKVTILMIRKIHEARGNLLESCSTHQEIRPY